MTLICDDEMPEDIHGWTRGKLYSFRDDGKCAECLIEACERQQIGTERPRTALGGPVTILDCPEIAWTPYDQYCGQWTIVLTVK